jgi:RimJ/RimL family protein N-acetyltransferase
MTIPTITTPRLVLRAFTQEDVEPLYHILRQEDVLRYFPPTDPLPRDRVQKMVLGLLKHWEARGYGLWAVEARSGGQLMGRCGLQWLPDTKEVEVDFILGRTFWGQGFATEAARASLRHGFEELEVELVVGIVHVENRASQRVLEKLGMAILEQRQFFGMECYRYAIERSTYHTASQSWDSAALGR